MQSQILTLNIRKHTAAMIRIIFICFFVWGLNLPNQAGAGLPDTCRVLAGARIAVTHTALGKIRGYIHNGTYIYKGIPYARADRFMPPVPPQPWKGVKSTLAWGPVCPQMEAPSSDPDEVDFVFKQIRGKEGENCQVLNIWTQGLEPNGKRPVMVWIHGGGFDYGSSQSMPLYDGESLSRKGDVVMVSVNHRLNVLGFADLSGFGKPFKYSANTGMMDLVAALEWIHNNIENFGGDPNNVTIFGQSGGGAKVGTLMCAPSAKGLFHKAIIQSGADPRFQDPAVTRRLGRELVRELGLTQDTIGRIRTVPCATLIDAGSRAREKLRKALTKEGRPPLGFGFGFCPCRDGGFLPYDARDPRALKLSGNVALLTGSTKTEFLKSMWQLPVPGEAGPNDVAGFLNKQYGQRADAFAAAVKKAYPGDTDICLPIDVDTRFRRACLIHAGLKSKYGDAPVYTYLFAWNSPVLDGNYKSVHCMDLPFVFNNIALAENMTGGGPDAYVLAHAISRAWINFARSANPNHSGLPFWPVYTKTCEYTMLLDNICTVKANHDKALLQFTENEPRLW